MNTLRTKDICLANLKCDNKFSLKNISAEVTFKQIDLYLVEKILVHIIWSFEKIKVVIFFFFKLSISIQVWLYSIHFSYNVFCWSGSNVVGIFFRIFQINDTRGVQAKSIMRKELRVCGKSRVIFKFWFQFRLVFIVWQKKASLICPIRKEMAVSK